MRVTHMRSIRHTWQSAVSHVLNITGEPVNLFEVLLMTVH